MDLSLKVLSECDCGSHKVYLNFWVTHFGGCNRVQIKVDSSVFGWDCPSPKFLQNMLAVLYANDCNSYGRTSRTIIKRRYFRRYYSRNTQRWRSSWYYLSEVSLTSLRGLSELTGLSDAISSICDHAWRSMAWSFWSRWSFQKKITNFLITTYIVLQVDEGFLDPTKLIRRVQEKYEFVLKFGKFSIFQISYTMYSQPGQAAFA